MSVGVLAFGAYLPQRRLQRKVIAAAHSWFEPSLAGLGRGERSMGSWDEDCNTLAVEAARAPASAAVIAAHRAAFPPPITAMS